MTGTTRLKLNQFSMKQIPVILPPIDEQHKIVEKLEELFSELDNSIANLRKAKEQLKIYRQSVLANAFSGKLTGENISLDYRNLPDGWVSKKLEQVCIKIQDGSHYSPKKTYQEPALERFLYITSKNIRNNYLDLSTIEYVDKDFHDSIFKRCNPEVGDVLLTKDGANTGNVTLNTLDEEFSLLSSVCLLKPQKGILDSAYLKYFIQSPVGYKSITGAMTGTAIKRIILKAIKEALIVIPPIDEQEHIVSEIELRFSVAGKLEQTINENLKLAELLRQSILKKAFAGRLI